MQTYKFVITKCIYTEIDMQKNQFVLCVAGWAAFFNLNEFKKKKNLYFYAYQFTAKSN